jgi:malate dehydrogenase
VSRSSEVVGQFRLECCRCSLAFLIARGGVFRGRRVDLRLLDIALMEGKLRSVGMEMLDCAPSCIAACTCTTDPRVAFGGADVALLVGARPRSKDMLRKDLLGANKAIFEEQGRILAEVASPDVKVVVVGNPCNTNALVCIRAAGSTIPPQNITAMTRLDQNRATGMLAAKTGE